MSKKIESIIFIILLLFVGFVALTQESDIITDENDFGMQESEEINVITLDPKEPARWFRSNAGGLAIEEKKSKIIALRSEYTLSIESAYSYEVPGYLNEFYNDEYYAEIRTLYKNSSQVRTQWLFRDNNQKTRLIAVIFESIEARIIPAAEVEEKEESETIEINEVSAGNEENEEEKNIVTKEERIEYIERKNGFIEIFDEGFNLLTEYTYYRDGTVNRIDFEYNEKLLISAASQKKDQSEDDTMYIKTFTDFYKYNRSLFLRSIERIFYTDMKAKEDDLVRISFPRSLRDAASNFTISERLNMYPDFFGDVFIENESKMIFDIDSRGRILSQTLYDEKDEVIWVINNTWQNNRIIFTSKTMGDLILAAEYQYNMAGDMISEKNLKNGVLERTVKVEGDYEIEELYLNNIVILRAIWEEGVKISETRVK